MWQNCTYIHFYIHKETTVRHRLAIAVDMLARTSLFLTLPKETFLVFCVHDVIFSLKARQLWLRASVPFGQRAHTVARMVGSQSKFHLFVVMIEVRKPTHQIATLLLFVWRFLCPHFVCSATLPEVSPGSHREDFLRRNRLLPGVSRRNAGSTGDEPQIILRGAGWGEPRVWSGFVLLVVAKKKRSDRSGRGRRGQALFEVSHDELFVSWRRRRYFLDGQCS